MPVPTLIAHRGYSAKYPENTLASIEAALSAGAEIVEFDVQMMADDEFILMHDSNLLRSSGVSKSVFSLTSTTVRNFEADHYSTFSTQFSGIRIPLLDHVISLFRQFPDASAMVEIKQDSLEEFGVEHVMKKLLSDLKNIKERCYIISFSYDAIEYTKQHSEFKTGYVLHKYDTPHFEQAHKLKPDLLICNYRKLPALDETGTLEEAALWPGDWKWALYEIDDAELALNYGRNGAAFIETNQIGPMLQHKDFIQEVKE
ncbi:MAG: glycerophosphodiester phosphodiesterase family protein [Gammaproteobacteria bacterium]|nr:glycerophosphodiester phosphodiesterase family protein [Gammaproteobacteria bacterium]